MGIASKIVKGGLEAVAKKAAKEAYDETPEGQRILREKAEAKSKRLNSLGSHAKCPRDIKCSYCQSIYKHDSGQGWLKCSLLFHTKCSVISCQGSDLCHTGYAQHISIATEQHEAMVIDNDDRNDGGDDEGLENESDDYEATEFNDIGGFDGHEDEFDEDRSSMKLR